MKKKLSILIIEDEVAMAQAVCEKLKNEGFTVHAAYNGEQGLELALDKHPDLILLDLLMPLVNGEDMLNELRKDPWGQQAKVIIFTNFSESEARQKVKELNVIDFIVKAETPIPEVLEKIHSALKS